MLVELLDATPSNAEYRRLAVLRCSHLLADAVEGNGGHYTSALVPNFTVLQTLLICDFDAVVKTIEGWPALDPETEYQPAAAPAGAASADAIRSFIEQYADSIIVRVRREHRWATLSIDDLRAADPAEARRVVERLAERGALPPRALVV